MLLLFLVAFIFSVLSHTFALGYMVDYENGYIRRYELDWLYYGKHLSIVLIALVNLALLPARIGKVSLCVLLGSMVVFMPILSFTEIGRIIYVQYILFFSACVFLSQIYKCFSVRILTLLTLILLMPIVLDHTHAWGTFIYTSYYGGRLGGSNPGRLLLGFFHPKETGIAYLVVMLLIKFKLVRKSRRVNLIFNIACLVLLTFIQSRNAVLFFINFLLFSYLFRKIGFKIAMRLYAGFLGVGPLIVLGVFFQTLNKMSGNRLLKMFVSDIQYVELYGASTNKLLQSQMDIIFSTSIPKYHADGFYIEYLIEYGFIPGILLILALLYVMIYLKGTQVNGIYVNAIYISFLILNIFDSGMFSTGNFLSVFVWSFVILGLKERYRHNCYLARLPQNQPSIPSRLSPTEVSSPT
ncbi:hypothetical protein WDW89_23505 [Deltaproteobacteria bacterium TL4]